MLRRAFVLLLATVAMAGCVDSYNEDSGYRPPPNASRPLPGGVIPRTPAQAPTLTDKQNSAKRVAILLPLTGQYAEIGQAMRQAAQLALPEGSTPALDVRDTGGSPDGATNAAREAIAAGAGLILGPLTSAETAAVAPVAREAGVAVLAFTNDSNQAQPGVWTLGISPTNQVLRLMTAAQAQNKGTAAAFLPDTDLGHRLGDALQKAAASLSLPSPNVRYHAAGLPAINEGMKEVSEYATRRGPLEGQIRAARALGTAEGRRHAAQLARNRVPPPSYGVLLLADTGDALPVIESLLPYYDIDGVQLMGPVQWSSPDSGSGHMPGAWYAAPDPASRSGFVQDYSGKFGGAPPAIADLAFDAATLARTVAAQGTITIAGLTQPAGFQGVDGWFALLPNGEVKRGLALFRIERGGSAMVEPAPARPAGT